MQNVSQEWKDNQNELLVSESYVELSLKLTDPDAYADATAEHNGSVYFADEADYVVSEVDKNIDPHATLERNLWLLDGSRKILPASGYGENGFIGDVICGANGTFTKNPIISVNFSKVFTDLISGVTITWSSVFSEYATDFIVTAYNDNTVVARTTVTDNTEVGTTAYVDVINYNKITVEVLKWSLPHRRARIAAIQIGTNLIYAKSDIISYSHSQDVDPISATLPKSEISFSINNVDDTYNPNNLNSLAKYLIERQEVKVRYGFKLNDKVEWIDSGTFYISEWDAPQNGLSADFTARDLLEFMTGTYYYGTYNPNGTSLYDLAENVLIDADLPLDESGSVKWVIDAKLKNIYTIAPLPIDTHANCLQMIANAGGCAIYPDRDGIIHIERIDLINRGDGTNPTFIVEEDNPYDAVILGISFKGEALPDVLPKGTIIQLTAINARGGTYDYEGVLNTVVKGPNFFIEPTQIEPNYGAAGIRGDITITLPDYWDEDYAITPFNSYSKSDIALSKPLKQVDVPCYSYSVASEITELYNGSVNVSGTKDVLVTYSGTAHNVAATVSGGTLNSARYCSNACVLNITATGTVSIVVKGYALNSSTVTVSTPSDTKGETISVDNPLITSHNRAVAIGEWVESYMKNRMVLSSDWRADPRLDALDVVKNENDYNTNRVLMTSVEYSYNGAFKGKGEGRVI